MSEVRKRLRDVKVSHISFKFYQFIFDLLIAVVISIILTRLFRLPIPSAVVPFIFLGILALYLEFREWNIIKVIQGRYQVLDERLQTALEVDTTNPIAQSLVEDVSMDIEDIEDSTFIQPKSLAIRVTALIGVSFILLIVGYLGLFYFDLNQMLGDEFDKVKTTAGAVTDDFETLLGERWEASNNSYTQEEDKLGSEVGGEKPGYSEGEIPDTGGGVGGDGSDDIYGDSSSASLYGRDIDFQVHPEYGGSIDIRESTGRDNPNQYAVGDAQSVEACRDCQVGPEHEELVRKYFQKITES